jgi:hypothetical protein
MNLSNYSNFSVPSPSNSPSPSPSPSSLSPVPSPSSFRAFSPSPSSLSPVPSPVPSPSFSPSSFNASFERFNHSSSTSSIRQQEINFFLAYTGITFCFVLIFVYFTRKHLYNLCVDTRKYVDVTPGDTELKSVTKYGVLNQTGETKSYGEFGELDELEHKERQVAETDCL